MTYNEITSGRQDPIATELPPETLPCKWRLDGKQSPQQQSSFDGRYRYLARHAGFINDHLRGDFTR